MSKICLVLGVYSVSSDYSNEGHQGISLQTDLGTVFESFKSKTGHKIIYCFLYM